MPNTELDLWPDDIGHSDLVAPVAILRQQASILSKKTKNLVRGDVISEFHQSSEQMMHHFFLVAPALDDYRYKLFTISHDISFYPIHMHSEETGEKSDKIENQEALQEALKKEFNSKKARSVIESMIAQSEGIRLKRVSG